MTRPLLFSSLRRSIHGVYSHLQQEASLKKVLHRSSGVGVVVVMVDFFRVRSELRGPTYFVSCQNRYDGVHRRVQASKQ